MKNKLIVSWIDDNDEINQLMTDGEYPNIFDPVMACIQDVVEDFENNGICVDQGGDDTGTEFNFPDGGNLLNEANLFMNSMLKKVGKYCTGPKTFKHVNLGKL